MLKLLRKLFSKKQSFQNIMQTNTAIISDFDRMANMQKWFGGAAVNE